MFSLSVQPQVKESERQANTSMDVIAGASGQS